MVDTGGIVPDDQQLIPAEIFRQARVALEEADAIVMVVDGRTELASPDIELARLLLRTGKPLLLAVNKVDTPQLEPYAEEFRRLGIRELFPISAENGNGIAGIAGARAERDARQRRRASRAGGTQTARRPSARSRDDRGTARSPKPTKFRARPAVAIIGRPNVGKSTLLNALTGTSRAIVSPIAGTTRDAVDELVERDGQEYRFIDTAGIRRKGKTELMAEKLSVVMARKHLEAADVALMMIDATEGVTGRRCHHRRLRARERALGDIVINKWDLCAPHQADTRRRQDRAARCRDRRSTRSRCGGI